MKGNFLPIDKDDDTPIISVQIFGWDIYRIFRDEDKNIIAIVLMKDGVFREFKWSDLTQ